MGKGDKRKLDENLTKNNKKSKNDQINKKSKKEIIGGYWRDREVKKDKDENKKEKPGVGGDSADSGLHRKLIKLGDYHKIVPTYVDLTMRNGHLFSDWRKHRKSCYIGKNLSKYDKSSLKETCKGRSPWENRFHGQAKALQKYEAHIRKNRMGQLKQLYGKQCGCWCAVKDKRSCHFWVLKKLVIERLIQMRKIEKESEKDDSEITDEERKEILCMNRALKFASHKGFDFEKKVETNEHSESSDEETQDDVNDEVSESSENEDKSASENESEKESD